MWLDCPDGAAGTSADSDTSVSPIIRYIDLVGVLVNITRLAHIGIRLILARGKTQGQCTVRKVWLKHLDVC